MIYLEFELIINKKRKKKELASELEEKELLSGFECPEGYLKEKIW